MVVTLQTFLRQLLAQPLFWLGVATRVILLLVFTPIYANSFYVPFLEFTVSTAGVDPWYQWMNNGGDLLAFPYGTMMWLVFLPGFAVSSLFGFSGDVAYFGTLFLVEITVLFLLAQMLRARLTLLLIVFWLSPITLVASYIYGFNDIVPICLLLVMAFCMQRNKWQLAGIGLASAISAKLSMVIALPFAILYLVNNPPLRRFIRQFGLGFMGMALFLFLPFALSHSGMQMLIENPELAKVWQLNVPVIGNQLLVVPFIYVLLIYWAWRARRINLDIMLTLIGLLFLSLALVITDTPGWLLWSLPFITLYQCRAQGISVPLGIFFALIYGLHVLHTTSPMLYTGNVVNFSKVLALPPALNDLVNASLFTLMVCTGSIMGLRMSREAITQNSFFQITRRPFMVGIAGDSGTGKDTLADSLISLFGAHSAMNISGDDYHKYDRGKPVWRIMTHLNPAANNLDLFHQDVSHLRQNRSVTKRYYDHKTGKLSRLEKVRSRDFIMVSGLHAFMAVRMQQLFDLRIYLNMDEELKRYFKIRRDSLDRNKKAERVIEEMELRRSDYDRFVKPQISHADIIFSLKANQSLNQNVSPDKLHFSLTIELAHGSIEDVLSHALIGICQCQVTPTDSIRDGFAAIEVTGEISEQQTALAAQLICPDLLVFLDSTPGWHGGMLGVMQLAALAVMGSTLTKLGIHENFQ
ncbi:MAG: hypothetical protein ACON4F_02730 [Candidatus Puniceispirillaceae bacterium]